MPPLPARRTNFEGHTDRPAAETCVHAVLESASMRDARPGPRPTQIAPLSALRGQSGPFAKRAVAVAFCVLGLWLAGSAIPGVTAVRADGPPVAPGSPPVVPDSPPVAPPVPTPVPASADEEAKAEQIERQTKKGVTAFERGNHDEALTRMDRLAKLDPESPLPTYLKARILTRTGKYEEALVLATAAATAHPDDRGVEALRFDLLRRLGRDDDAAKAVEDALAARPDDLVALTMRGQLHEAGGRRTQAQTAYDAVIAAYNTKDPKPEEMSAVAAAALRATRLSTNVADDLTQGALKLLKRRIEEAPDDVDAILAYADVYQAKRGAATQATAGKYYRQLLDQNPEVVEARLGQARIALIFWDQAKAIENLERALTTNPNFVPAMTLLARIRIGDGDYEKADEFYERAKKVNPRDKDVRAARAARLWITGDKAGFEALEKELLGEDPTFGTLYTVTAELVGERQRRFDVAAEFSKKAIAVDPTDDQAYVIQGVNFMNLGREDEAKASFEKATEVSKRYADVMRDNFKEVLGVLDAFVTTKTANFIVKQHVEESAIMEPYLLPILEQARTDLAKKYGFEPAGPVIVESFHRHDDFSARSVGAQNIPALGVCFGKVITLDGPLSRGLGEFSWARTAWHEYAHVVTLEQSKGQVPRWLTEGLSVHEEKSHKPEWGREMDRELFDRVRTGRLLKMATINQAFRGPDIMFAYFQGGLIADYVKETSGFEAITKMLKRFADDVPTAKVFEEVLGIPLAEFDGRFAKYAEGLVKDFRLVPRYGDESKKAFEVRIAKDPKDVEAWTKLGFARIQRGQAIDVGEALAKAKELAPDANETILLEAELARSSNRQDLAKAAYERFLAAGGDDMACRLALAKYALDDRRSSDAMAHFEAAKKCFPRFVGKGNPYVELSKLYEGEGRAEKSIAELEAYAAIAQEDYGVRKKLASWYEAKKDDAKVIKFSNEMIEISPFGANRGKAPDLDLHKRYAQALTRTGRKVEAVREWKVDLLLIALLPEEARREAGAVDVRLTLGELLLDMGQPDEAYEQALGALAVDPDSLPAKALKARASGAGADK